MDCFFVFVRGIVGVEVIGVEVGGVFVGVVGGVEVVLGLVCVFVVVFSVFIKVIKMFVFIDFCNIWCIVCLCMFFFYEIDILDLDIFYWFVFC